MFCFHTLEWWKSDRLKLSKSHTAWKISFHQEKALIACLKNILLIWITIHHLDLSSQDLQAEPCCPALVSLSFATSCSSLLRQRFDVAVISSRQACSTPVRAFCLLPSSNRCLQVQARTKQWTCRRLSLLHASRFCNAAQHAPSEN